VDPTFHKARIPSLATIAGRAHCMSLVKKSIPLYVVYAQYDPDRNTRAFQLVSF